MRVRGLGYFYTLFYSLSQFSDLTSRKLSFSGFSQRPWIFIRDPPLSILHLIIVSSVLRPGINAGLAISDCCLDCWCRYSVLSRLLMSLLSVVFQGCWCRYSVLSLNAVDVVTQCCRSTLFFWVLWSVLICSLFPTLSFHFSCCRMEMMIASVQWTLTRCSPLSGNFLPRLLVLCGIIVFSPSLGHWLWPLSFVNSMEKYAEDS